jgi:hypothetical protein
MKIHTKLVAAAAPIALVLGFAGSAQASYPTCTNAYNYAAFQTGNVSDFLGSDTGFAHSTWQPLSCLTNGDNLSVSIQYEWDGRNFGGAGNPEDVTYTVNVYNRFVSCDGQSPTAYDLGILHGTHHHYGGTGSHSNDVSTACS